MKKIKLIYVLCLFFASIAAMANCSVIEELVQISHQGCKLQQKTLEEAAPAECALLAKENALMIKLFSSKIELGKVASLVTKLDGAVYNRLIDRAKFEASHGNKKLADLIQSWELARKPVLTKDSKPEKIGRVYGVDLNLRDGKWNFTPDGKRFWVSNEYPDIILTPTEYRSVVQTSSAD
jgi:hypothetical protein